MLKLGIVTSNNDPDNLRRVKVQSADRGSSVSDWLVRLTSFNGQDLPVPEIGDTVLIGSIDGDSHDDCVLGVLTTSTSNKPLNKPNLQNYFSYISEQYQNRADTIKLQTFDATVEMLESGRVVIKNSLGSITLLESGYTVIQYPTGSITFGSGGLNIDTSLPIQITSPSLLHNGNQVAVIGGIDSRGDTTLS